LAAEPRAAPYSRAARASRDAGDPTDTFGGTIAVMRFCLMPLVALGSLACLVWPNDACAQTGTASRASGSWELEFAGGGVLSPTPSGTAVDPAPGASILTSGPTFSSRQVSSWLFGDGASMLNLASAAKGLTSQVVPLDAAFGPMHTSGGGSAALRVRHWLGPRWALEANLDVLVAGSTSGSGLATAAATTRDSFKSTFGALLATGPLTGFNVTATSATAGTATAKDLAATGALRWRLGSGSWAPYLTFGGGLTAGIGTLPSASVSAAYQFSAGQVPISETDHVTLQYNQPTTWTGMVGGGLRHEWSATWALDADVRVFIGPSGTQLLLDASPSVTTSTQAGEFETLTNPDLQFSNNPSTGRQSTLSGPSIQNFVAFSGGLQTRVLVAIGLVRRF
jgi:hypothetical protein